MTNNEYRCKLYHKTTWFETLSSVRLVIMVTLVANYITKLRGLKPQIEQSAPQPQDLSCKLYHKTTWFETPMPANKLPIFIFTLQIISQNYVV